MPLGFIPCPPPLPDQFWRPGTDARVIRPRSAVHLEGRVRGGERQVGACPLWSRTASCCSPQKTQVGPACHGSPCRRRRPCEDGAGAIRRGADAATARAPGGHGSRSGGRTCPEAFGFRRWPPEPRADALVLSQDSQAVVICLESYAHLSSSSLNCEPCRFLLRASRQNPVFKLLSLLEQPCPSFTEPNLVALNCRLS